MARRNLSGGSRFEEIIGYSRVVDDGMYIYVSGTGGFDYANGTIPDGVVEQAEQTFRNVKQYLEMAGCSLADVVKVTYVVTEPEDWPRVVPIIGEHMRSVKPAATAFFARLADPRMKIEVEVIARKPN